MTTPASEPITIGTGGRLYAVAAGDVVDGQTVVDLPAPRPRGKMRRKAQRKPETAPNTPVQVPTAQKRLNWREIGSNLAELSGIGAISAGFWLITPSAGLISAGVGAVVLGLAFSRRPDGGDG